VPKLDRHAVLFSLSSFAAALGALFIAFAIGLPRPYWAMATAYIVSQPLSGAVRSKAAYRLVGTLIGGAAAVAMVPNLVDAPVLLSLAMALWVSACLVVSLFDRTPRSYLLMLAGYTAAIIGFSSVNQPQAIFDVAVARVVEIGLGIACATVVHSLVFPRPVGDVLRARIQDWLGEADHWLLDLLDGRAAAANTRDRRHLAAAATEIRLLAVHLPFDTSRLRDTSAAVQAMHDRMLMLIPLLSGLADRLEALDGDWPGHLRPLLSDVRQWLVRGAAHDQGRRLADRLQAAAAARPGRDWRDLLVESLLVRLSEAVTALAEAHALTGHLADPAAPLPSEVATAIAGAVTRPLHADVGLALRSGAAVLLAVAITCAIWIGTGWPDGAVAAMMAAVFCALFSTLDDPAPAIASFGVYTLAGLPLAALYLFAILPAIDGFPLLAATLFPPLFVIGLYMADTRHTARAMPVALAFCSGLALQETLAPDFAAFLNANLGQFVGIFVAIAVTQAIRSMSAEASVARLLHKTWAGIGRLARHGAAEDPADFAALLIDRLALLTPRLSHRQEGGDRVTEDALRDLRVAMNLMSVQQARAGLEPAAQARIDRLSAALADHYARLPRLGRRIGPALVRAPLDAAILGLAGDPAAADRRAVLGLVGIRRNLFPAARTLVVPVEAAS
jgi:uncharacterized membrane protein YccC